MLSKAHFFLNKHEALKKLIIIRRLRLLFKSNSPLNIIRLHTAIRSELTIQSWKNRPPLTDSRRWQQQFCPVQRQRACRCSTIKTSPFSQQTPKPSRVWRDGIQFPSFAARNRGATGELRRRHVYRPFTMHSRSLFLTRKEKGKTAVWDNMWKQVIPYVSRVCDISEIKERWEKPRERNNNNNNNN